MDSSGQGASGAEGKPEPQPGQPDRVTGEDYKKAFGLPDTPKSYAEKALNLALDIRKFEDLLEDGVVGPLYKTVLSNADLRFTKWWGPYRFSVSKLNQLLSLFVVLLFLVLLIATLSRYYRLGWPPDKFATTTLILTIVAIATLCWKGRTGPWRSRVRAEPVRRRSFR